MHTTVETTTIFCTDRHKPELTELVQKIKLAAKDAIDSSHDALHSAITAGGHLVKAQERILYGKWGAWLAENFEFKQSTANNWMRLWKYRKELMELVKGSPKQYISVADALRLVSDTPIPPPKTKLQMVKKRCGDVIKIIYSQSQSEANKSRQVLIEHINEVGAYVRSKTQK